MKRIVSFPALFALVLFAGCGGSPGGAAGAKPPAPTPAGSSFEEDGTTETTEGEEKPEPDKEITTVDGAQRELDESTKAFDASSGDCARMCKALASMRRAVDHLCGLVPPDDDGKKKCDDARARVTSAEEKLKAACGGCG